METIIFAHGMWGNGHVFDKFRQPFEAAGHRTQAINYRYHGQKPNEPLDKLGATSITAYRDDIKAVAMQSKEEPKILIGHSMGGLVVPMAAQCMSKLVRAMVLLTPAWPSGIYGLEPSVMRCFMPMLKWGFWRKPYHLPFSVAKFGLFNGFKKEVDQYDLWQQCVPESGRAASEIGFEFIDPNRATEVDENELACPILIIAGGRDRICPAKIVKKTAEKYARHAPVTYQEFPDQAHWVLGQPGWEEVAEYALNWISNL